MIPIRNTVLRTVHEDRPAIGLVIRLARSGEIALIAKAAGYDFLWIDGQHAIYSLETISHIIQAANGADISPLVRVQSTEDQSASLLLDAGAMGIIFPDVSTGEQARRAVTACKFAPIGNRSVMAGGYANLDYHPYSLPETMDILNKSTLVVCMIETPQGLENIEDIVSTPGVDAIFIGCNDLLVNLGRPGEFGHPTVTAAVERVTSACKTAGKISGVGGDNDAARIRQFVGQGARIVVTPTDQSMLLTEARSRVRALRTAAAS